MWCCPSIILDCYILNRGLVVLFLHALDFSHVKLWCCHYISCIFMVHTVLMFELFGTNAYISHALQLNAHKLLVWYLLVNLVLPYGDNCFSYIVQKLNCCMSSNGMDLIF